MIRDLFHKRYKEFYFSFSNYFGGPETIPEYVESFFTQAIHIIFNDIKPILKNSEEFFSNVYWTFTRELGVGSIGKGNSVEQNCLSYLLNPYNVWMTNDNISDFIKKKISLIELIFGMVEEDLQKTVKKNLDKEFYSAVDEINQRFKTAKLGFYYQNKMMRTYDDKLTQQNILEPYWEILTNPKWQLVDNDIREAFERFNNNKEDASFYAMRGLESVIKIISNDLNLTTGKEKGASNFIDNLSSKKKNYRSMGS
jgi:hypothetical protein